MVAHKVPIIFGNRDTLVSLAFAMIDIPVKMPDLLAASTFQQVVNILRDIDNAIFGSVLTVC